VPHCGIFTDVDDENIRKVYKKHFEEEDAPPLIPNLKLKSPDQVLENSINDVHFLRSIKVAKEKNISDLFDPEFQQQLMQIFTRTNVEGDEEGMDVGKIKSPNNTITIQEFNEICMEKLERIIDNETFELIFYVFDKPTTLDNVEIDFNLFARLFYLIYKKNELVNLDEVDDEFLIQSEGNNSKLINKSKEQFGEYSESHGDKRDYDEDYDEYKKDQNGEEDEEDLDNDNDEF